MSVTHRKGNIGAMLQRSFVFLHVHLYRLSGGIVGSKIGNISFLLLTTTGRKSGKARVTSLSYIPEGKRFLLVASNWGSEKHPLWWLNLQAHPQASVMVGRKTLRVTARQADAEERQRLWPQVTAQNPSFASYQAHISREIPVVILTPDVS